MTFLVSTYGATTPKVQEADALFLERGNEYKARRAFQIYESLAKQESHSFENFWRYSMACQFIGMRFEKDDDEKKRIFKEGEEYGKRGVELKPDCAPCQFWTGINMALYAQEVGILKMLFTLGTVESYLKKAAELEPSYALGGAYRVLGLIQKNLPGILGGSDELAVQYLEKAIASSPNTALNYLVLAEIYRDSFHDYEKAIQLASKGSQIKPRGDDPIEEIESKVEIKALVEELKEFQKTLALNSSPKERSRISK